MSQALLNTAAPTAVRTELVSVQYLRAVAALGVVVWHAQGQMGLAETQVLQAGIEIFFVISGYVMWLILSERPVSPMTFLKKRIARVVPLYWLLTTLMVGLLIAAPSLLQSTRFDPAHIVASYLFIAWPNPVEGVGLKPVMIPGWTLNYEMAFYGLLAVALALKARWRAPLVIGTLCLLSLLSLVPMPPVLHFYASPFMTEMAMGMGLAIGLKRMPGAWFRFGGPAILLGGGLLLFGASVIDAEANGRLLLFGVPATILIGGMVMLERAGGLPNIPVLKAIGDASYPLYMIHPVLLSAMAQAWRMLYLGDLPAWLYVVAALAVTLVAGWIVHVTMERPLVAAFRPKARAARSPPSPIALGVAATAEDAQP
ncbi:MAG: acyltransferase [Pseudomonadota bacterium]